MLKIFSIFFKSLQKIGAKKLSPKHIILGKKGEKIALKYLRKNNYILLDKNWQFNYYEIDLICLYDKTLVFIEVKTRTDNNLEMVIHSFHEKKRMNLIKAAENYIVQKKMEHLPCRFDLICIYDGLKKMEHYENVIAE